MSDTNQAPNLNQSDKLRHPRGLWVLFITEMWERFSYYGMRAILVLYLIASTAEELASGVANNNPGFGWANDNAYLLYGVYTFMVYMTAIFGGILADRFLGTHRSMLIGGWTIAAGHITLAITNYFDITPGTVVTFQNSPGSVVCFMIGLALIIVGTGFFKPCVSVMVGQLYEENDPRRDSGFTIFYMGINLGALFSPLVAGTLGELVGWHWGFGSAAVGMIAGLFFYQGFRSRYLGNIGLPPDGTRFNGRSLLTLLGIGGGIVAIPVIPLVLWLSGGLTPFLDLWAWLTATNLRQAILWLSAAGAVVGTILAFVLAQRPHERSPLGVIFVLAFVGNIFFWTAFEQAGSSMNVFAKKDTDRTVWGLLSSDDVVQTVKLDDKMTAGDGFALTFSGETTSDVVVAATTADDLLDAVRGLSTFANMEIEIKTTDKKNTAAAIVAGDVVRLIFKSGKESATLADYSENSDDAAAVAPPLVAVAPANGTDGSASVSVALIEYEGFPASWYQSVNPLCIILFAPIFAWLWIRLDRRRLNPSTPLKFSIGLWLLGLAFISMVFGAMDARDGLAAPHWLAMTYIVVTWGELCLSPVGLSMVTKLAPLRLQSFMMGVWFFTFALSNLFAGLVARISTKFIPDVETGDAELTFLGYEGLSGFFLMLVVFPIGAGFVILLLTPFLKRMMHGIK